MSRAKPESLFTLTQSFRRVSTTLRHPAWEFTDFLPLSFRRVEVVC
jgi:hypothetical protein